MAPARLSKQHLLLLGSFTQRLAICRELALQPNSGATPGGIAQRDGAFAVTFTVIDADQVATATLVRTVVLPFAGVVLGRRTFTGTGARVLPFRGSAATATFAGIQPTAGMGFLQNANAFFRTGLRLVLLVFSIHEARARQQAAKSRCRKLRKAAAIHSRIFHEKLPMNSNDDCLWGDEHRRNHPTRYEKPDHPSPQGICWESENPPTDWTRGKPGIGRISLFYDWIILRAELLETRRRSRSSDSPER